VSDERRVRSSPDRGSFSMGFQKKKLEEDPENDGARAMVDWLDEIREEAAAKIVDPEWQKDNLEYDLRTSDWIAEKCKDDRYAQNLYAAMCNRDFIKNDLWPLLKGERWSCSWRYAGGIVADIREEGDYIDWYCSGIRNVDYDEKINKCWDARRYVAESVVTDEIREDLFRLGWLVCDDDE